jgi:hypothetical protein
LNVSKICNPDLIDPGHRVLFDQVRIDGIGMMAIGCPDESTAFLHSQSSLSHDPLDFLVVYEQPLSMELGRNLAVPIPGELFGDSLYPICQRPLLGGCIRNLGTVIIAASREVHELAPPRDAFEQVSVVGNELPLL